MYKKRYNNCYKRKYKRNTYPRAKRSNTTKTWGDLAWSMTPYALKGLKLALGLNTEKKLLQNSYGPVAIPDTSNGSLIALTNVAQGDGEVQRNGNAIRANWISARVKVKRHGDDASLSTMVRFMVIRDNRCNGSTTPLDEIMTQESMDGERLESYYVRTHYQILWDKVFVLNKDENEIKYFKFFLPFNEKVHYTGSASTNYGVGNVFLYYFSEHSDGTNLPTFDANTQLSFVDN